MCVCVVEGGGAAAAAYGWEGSGKHKRRRVFCGWGQVYRRDGAMLERAATGAARVPNHQPQQATSRLMYNAYCI